MELRLERGPARQDVAARIVADRDDRGGPMISARQQMIAIEAARERLVILLPRNGVVDGDHSRHRLPPRQRRRRCVQQIDAKAARGVGQRPLFPGVNAMPSRLEDQRVDVVLLRSEHRQVGPIGKQMPVHRAAARGPAHQFVEHLAHAPPVRDVQAACVDGNAQRPFRH